MKRKGYLIRDIADINNLYLAFYKAAKGKHNKQSCVTFSANLHQNLKALQKQILTGNIQVGQYHYFVINDPKTRLICAADFSERVLHHAIMNICHPYFERVLIYDSYATRINKGIYAALSKARKAVIHYKYVGKLDFKKYFDHISHSVLKKQLAAMFKDKSLLELFNKIIDSYEVTPHKGIPIGNLTSQYFANFYLSGFDHYVKEKLCTPVYIRYMDDIVVFANDKKELLSSITCMHTYAKEKLELIFKPFVLGKTLQGTSFLGYKVFPHKILLNGNSKKRFIKKASLYHGNLLKRMWDEHTFGNHIIPLLAFIKHAYCKAMRKQYLFCDSA